MFEQICCGPDRAPFTDIGVAGFFGKRNLDSHSATENTYEPSFNQGNSEVSSQLATLSKMARPNQLSRLYKWRPGRAGSFKNQLTFAWYLYIENKSEFRQIQSAHSLNLILLAARKHHLNNKKLSDITIDDFHNIHSSLIGPFTNEKTQRLTALYLLKFLQLLQEHQLVDVNLIDIAARL